jgi:hypothetical protein
MRVTDVGGEEFEGAHASALTSGGDQYRHGMRLTVTESGGELVGHAAAPLCLQRAFFKKKRLCPGGWSAMVANTV